MTRPHSAQGPETAATDAGGAMDRTGPQQAVTGLSVAGMGTLNGAPAHAAKQKRHNGAMSSADYRTSQSEAAFQRDVIAWAEARGWLVWHDNDPRRNRRGLPDLLLVRVGSDGVGRLIFYELKAQRGRVRPEQAAWLAALAAVPGVTARVCRPSDWPDMIQELL